MDPAIAKTLFQLGTYGPLGIMVAIGFMLFFMERKRNDRMQDKQDELAGKLHDLAMASIKSDMEHTRVNEVNVKVLESIDRRLS